MTENVNNMSKYNNECMDTNDKDEESITASTNNVKEEMKAEQNEEPIYASLKDNKVSQGNKVTDNAEALSINQVTKHEDIQGKGDDEKDKVKEKENGEKVQNNEKSNKEVLGKEYTQHITYEKDGEAIYTDPKTKFQYKWCKKANKWLAKQLNSNPYENEYYRWCNETRKWLPKSQLMTNEQTQQEQQQQQQQQQLQTETEYYKWDPEKRKWLLKPHIELAINMQNQHEIKYDVDENGQHICTDRDGTTFIWDIEKNAWFPKIDDHFMAIYQMNYGFNTTDNNNKELKEQANPNQEQNISDVNLTKMKEVKDELHDTNSNEDNNASGNHTDKDKQSSDIKRKMPESPKWFDLDPAHNTKVYVSNLPLDITLEEFAELMGKCGLIMRDTQTHKYKIKLYTEADGQIKGDGLCDYIKVESVELALKILDEYNLRGHKIRVQRAKFQMRGEYNPALKPKRKKKDKEKFAKIKEKLFDWRPEKMRGERSKHEKIVIIKNLFDPEIFEKDVQLILEYQNDLREECCKCGQVRKITIYDRHTEGVAQINMATVEEADLLIQMMHGRYFGKRQLTAEHWDGKTKYKIEETESEAQKRLNNWDEFLLSKEANKETSQKYVINMDESESRIIQTITECNVNLGEGDTGKQTNDDEGSKKKVTNNAEVS